jgi:hypothetical protein
VISAAVASHWVEKYRYYGVFLCALPWHVSLLGLAVQDSNVKPFKIDVPEKTAGFGFGRAWSLSLSCVQYSLQCYVGCWTRL